MSKILQKLSGIQTDNHLTEISRNAHIEMEN